MAEFTGERVIPGEVDPDLWNEHVARYFFAARMARDRRVLDAGCGSGYGSAALAREAREVLGIDVAQDAIDYAQGHFQNPRIRFERASCLQIPASDSYFDLVVAFEIIEHLHDWRAFLREVRRVLSPQGQFLVSTPNQRYYAEARAELGPNPFHVHEFAFAEFRDELAAVFPRVALYVENHTDAMVFTPLNSSELVDVRVEERSPGTEDA
ncbi:MAG: Methyltransferase type 11, partial [Bryobacterales bacterium]|nr:Methyltransferase type 11 [Bryobacterales bacterium]